MMKMPNDAVIYGLTEHTTTFVKAFKAWLEHHGCEVQDYTDPFPSKGHRGFGIINVTYKGAKNMEPPTLFMQSTLEGLTGKTEPTEETFRAILNAVQRQRNEDITSVQGRKTYLCTHPSDISHTPPLTAKLFMVHSYKNLLKVMRYGQAFDGLVGTEDILLSVLLRIVADDEEAVLVNNRQYQMKPTGLTDEYVKTRAQDLATIDRGLDGCPEEFVTRVRKKIAQHLKTDPVVCQWANRKVARGHAKRQRSFSIT